MAPPPGDAGSGTVRHGVTLVRRLSIFVALLSPAGASAQSVSLPPQPVFIEDFAYDPAEPAALLRKWQISGGLDKKIWNSRVAVVADRIGKTVGRITVEDGDALDATNEAMLVAKPYVCDAEGSRAAEMEAKPGGAAPTERAEIQVNADRTSGAGELVKFGEIVWYRFSFKLSGDWPRDHPATGRESCRTVIHQIKQNASKDGVDCGASPFFKIEARPFGAGAHFFAQVTSGASCATPPVVRRTRFCVADLPRDSWTNVNVRLFPAQDASGRVDVWLNGMSCGSYRGPMGDRENGRRRNGTAFVDVQPRFGIYRDRRADTQTIYFDNIKFWNAEPVANLDWGAGPPP